MFTVYGYPQTRATRVFWTLEELAAPYEVVLTSPRKEAKTDPYLSLNPGGKIPCLVEGDFVLTESVAICTYLADRYPEATLIPAAGTQARGLHDAWCYFIMTELEQALWTMAKHTYALPKAYRIPKVRETAEFEFQRAMAVLQDKLGERRFVIGDHFTVADIILFSVLNWRNGMKLTQPLIHKNIEEYFHAIQQRPSWIRVQEMESGLLD